MPPSVILFITFLAQSAWSYSDDLYQPSEPYDLSYYQDDYGDDNDIELERRANNHYLRFGRSDTFNKRHEPDFEDYNEDFARPTRSGHTGDKTDHFIRFGRSKQDFLRFGRRDKGSNYIRFGRSLNSHPENEARTRNKRDTYTDFKRGGSNYLRFGRNSNFLRFGRNHDNLAATAAVPIGYQEQSNIKNKVKEYHSPLIQFVMELIDNIKKEQNKCPRSA